MNRKVEVMSSNEDTQVINMLKLKGLLQKCNSDSMSRGKSKLLQNPLIVINVTNSHELERGFDNLRILSGKPSS